MLDLDPIVLEQVGHFMRLRIPYARKADRGIASTLPYAHWSDSEGVWYFPAAREPLRALERAFKVYSLRLDGRRRRLPPIADWVYRTQFSVGQFFPLSTAAVITARSSSSYGELCSVVDFRVTPAGSVEYTVLTQSGEEKTLNARSLGDARTFVIRDRASSVTDLKQIEIPLSADPMDPHMATVERSVAPYLVEAEAELIKYFAAKPDRLRHISPKKFEELVLAIYRNNGFDVEQLGEWNQADGGVDIIAVYRSSAVGELRLAIQCKQSRHAISARPIRELHGILDRFKAHKGVLCTTSLFTPHAILETQQHLWRVTLEDRNKLFGKLRGLVNLPGTAI